MDLSSQKRIAAKVLKCGITRVRIKESKEVEEALTREDIRALIRKGIIWKVQKKGTSRARARKILKQKKKGRKKGPGSRKGARGARNPKKPAWIGRVRPLRRLLRELKDSGKLKKDYRDIYLKIKGGFFRNKKHLIIYLKEHKLLAEKPAKKKLRKEAKEKKKIKPKKKVAKKAKKRSKK